jgi:hypothetical protein
MKISLEELYDALEKVARQAYDALDLLTPDEKTQAGKDLEAASKAVTAGEKQRAKLPVDKADADKVICTIDEKFEAILERSTQYELAHKIVLAYAQLSSSDPSVAVGSYGELQGLKDLLEGSDEVKRERSIHALRLALRRSGNGNMKVLLKSLVDIPVELVDDVG